VFFQILGEPGVKAGGTWYQLSAKRQRALFVLLCLSANRPLTREGIVTGIWGDAMPQHPDTAVHIVVSRLRNALGPASARLVSVRSGYRLDVAADELDLTVAQADFIRARALLRDNEPARALHVLSQALATWEADALADLSEFPFCAAARVDVAALRSSIEDLRNDALLASGRHIEVLSLLQSQIVLRPWDEQLRMHRMTALYRCGRQVDALREYDEFGNVLVDELGVEPSKELQDLRLRILDHDASLHLAKSGISVPIPPWTSTELPFVGRSDEEELVFARLREISDGGQWLIVAEGEPGIGKTRFAMETGRRISDNAIVLSATANDATRSAVLAVGDSLARASENLSDDELRVCLGQWPNELARHLPSIARRFPELGATTMSEDESRRDSLRDGVASWLIALSRRAPVVLLLDDMQRAGPALLQFLGDLFLRPEDKRVLVLATARSTMLDRSSKFEQLLASLAGNGCVDRIEFSGLDQANIEWLLTQLGIARPAETAQRVYDHTGGHPYFVQELLHNASLDLRDVPRTVRDFVRVRVANLGDSDRRTLEFAAGFVTGFDVALLSEVCGTPEKLVAAHINRALGAGILRDFQIGLYAYAHELTRRAVLESIDPDQLAEIHRCIALALERRGAKASLLAIHWSKARGVEGLARTFDDAMIAGSEAVFSIDPDAAARWFNVALEAATDDARKGRALLRLADAQAQAGDAACADSLRASVSLARRTRDDALLADCAGLWAPVWSSLPLADRDERVSLLEYGCEAAPDAETRARLTARLATELLHTGQQDRVVALAADALELSKELKTNTARAEIAMRVCHATWNPSTLGARRALIDDALRGLSRTDILHRAFVLAFAASIALEEADRERADIAFEEMFAIADGHHVLALELNVATTRALRAALNAEMDEAAKDAVTALEVARRVGGPNSVEGAMLQLAFIAWQQGRFADLLPVIEKLDEGAIGGVTKRVFVARALVREDRNAARRVFDAIPATDFVDLPQDMLWAVTLTFAAEVAFLLGSSESSSTLFRLLEPFRNQVAVANFALAPLAYAAGLAAATAGLPEYASLFAQAVQVSAQLGAPILQRRAESAWALATERFDLAQVDARDATSRSTTLDITLDRLDAADDSTGLFTTRPL
jgi:DNA-binding SARP family transcriptional activator